MGDLAVGGSASLTMTVTVDAVDSFVNAVEVTAADQEDVDSTPGDGQGGDPDGDLSDPKNNPLIPQAV